MKNPQRVPALAAIPMLALTVIIGCNKKDKAAPDPDLPPPVISSFTPAEAQGGTTVIITGQHFSDDKTKNQVKFNGIAAEVTVAKTTELSVTVPEEATTGKITVTVGDKTGTSSADFKVNPTAPTITNISPTHGNVGLEVTITGTRFTSDSKVYFGSIQATEVTFTSATSLKAKLPAGALNGKVRVTAGSLETISTTDFWVKPTITGFTPAKAKEGEVLTITGTNFSADKTLDTVWFGNVKTTDIVEATNTTIRVKVPSFTGNATIAVQLKDSTQTAPQFSILPNITGYTPGHAERGTLVTLSGKNFATDATLKLNGTAVTIETGRTATTLQFKVPADANSGSIVLRQAGTDIVVGNFEVTNVWVPFSTAKHGAYYADGVSFIYNNKIYVGMGRNSSGGFANTFHIFDLSTKTWSAGPTLPSTVSGRGLPSSFMVNNKFYVGMGNSSSGTRSDWWEYDPSVAGDAAWTSKGNVGGGYGGLGFTVGDRAFVAAFYHHMPLIEYKPATSGWTTVFPIDYSVRSALYSTQFVLNNKAYFGAGLDYSVASVQKMYVFDPANTSLGIKEMAIQMPYPDGASASTFVLNGKAYALTGYKMYEFSDAGAPTWTTTTVTTPEAIGVKSAAVVNGVAYCWTSLGTVYYYVPNY